VLINRHAERAALDSVLEAARGGRSAVLVLRGEPGVGKTTLLDYATESAAGLIIARVSGVESEMELAFAALHQLCTPMLGELDRLPDPQQAALGVALGLRSGDAPDRFLVGLAVLSLVSAVAEQQPLLCVVDDSQWLDRASSQVLAFVARRLLAEPVALLAAAREPGGDFDGLPELPVRGLAADDARELLGSVILGPLDERVRERIIAETGGNPLALLEVPPDLTDTELGCGFRLPPEEWALSHRIEDSFLRRFEALPAPTQRLLLVAAADPTGDPVLLWRAAERLGIGPQAAAPAEATGWLTIGQRVTFRHPLARSAVYRGAASCDDLRAAHQALAEVTDPEADPERRAWHRAQAVAGPDEQVADELERWAGRAQARGGPARAAAFLERSAALTPGPARRAERALAAAQATYQAGALDATLALLAAAEAGPLDELQAAQADLLRGQVALAANWGSDAPPLLVRAARRLERLDSRLARETYLDALGSAIFAAQLTPGGLQEVARAARAAPPAEPIRAADLLLDGLALVLSEGHAAGGPTLRQALGAFRSDGITREEELRWAWLAQQSALMMWDYQSLDVLSARHVALARETGSLASLSLAYHLRAGVHIWAGEFAEAEAMATEADSVGAAIGSSGTAYSTVALAFYRGREAKAVALTETARKDAERRGEGTGLTFFYLMTAVLCNSLGRYEEALAAATQASEDLPGLWFSTSALAELVEAATRSAAPGRAAAAFVRLRTITSACGTDWALGLEARCRALISDGNAADRSYREAIDRLGRGGLRLEAARAQLLYGEWLRRRQRSRDARDQLRSAEEAFDSMGAEAFAERARVELRASDGSVRKRAAAQDDLTAQEALIARLAGSGASNPEIAAQLYLSTATVAYHLRKVFTKLGISSRGRLVAVLPGQPAAPDPPVTRRPARPLAHAAAGRGARRPSRARPAAIARPAAR
jgi:DNA-binding CsgD family transcriptional regulator